MPEELNPFLVGVPSLSQPPSPPLGPGCAPGSAGALLGGADWPQGLYFIHSHNITPHRASPNWWGLNMAVFLHRWTTKIVETPLPAGAQERH